LIRLARLEERYRLRTEFAATLQEPQKFSLSNSEFETQDGMYEEYQIEIPQSFMALFVEPGRNKPNASREVVAERYELCEDMASMLTETARSMFLSLGITEDDVLIQCYRGLTGTGAVVTTPEAIWVVHRLAELLEWPQLRGACLESNEA
jgi:hypothetical protein